MNETEIMKALECCQVDSKRDWDCDNCPYNDNCSQMHKDALDLINRKNAEIDRITKERDNITKTYTEVVDAWQITRAEAIKEFAVRVKEELGDDWCWLQGSFIHLDQIVKEMGVEL